jgi:DNA end-binding protein Ku
MSTVTLSVSGASPGPEESPAGAVRGRGRASWSGLLRLGLAAIPVKAYAATASAPEIPCHQLHAGCGQRIRYEKRCSVHGPVEAGAIVSGYQYAPDQHLVLDEADLDRLRPANERALSLERCLEISQLNPVLFSGRSLYLLPDGPAAHPPYALLVHVFQERQQAALGQVVLGQRRQLALVRPTGDCWPSMCSTIPRNCAAETRSKKSCAPVPSALPKVAWPAC